MEEQLKELAKRVDENAKRSEDNVKRIYENIEKLHEHDEQISENTGAIGVLHAIKTANNRFFVMWIITFIGLILSIGYNIYLLNDVSSVETTTREIQQENESGANNYIGNDGDITYGKADN